MQVKTVVKTKRWNEESLALASREDLAADILVRQSIIRQLEGSQRLFARWRLRYHKKWMIQTREELEARQMIEG